MRLSPTSLPLCRLAPCALAALLACKSSPPPPAPAAPRRSADSLPEPVAVAEAEPNDFQRPQLVPSRAEIRGSLAPPAPRAVDDDWYRVEASLPGAPPAPGASLVLRVELEPAGPALEAWLEVLDAARSRLVRVRAEGGAGATIPAVLCTGACFVRVSGSQPAPYVLSILGAPRAAGVEVEPNDRAAEANELVPDQPLSGTFLSGDDEDWYRVSAPPAPGQILRIELTGIEGVRPELEVRTPEGALVATFRAAHAGDGLLVRDLPMSLPPGPPPARDAGLPFLPPPQFGAADGGDAGPEGATPDAGAIEAGPPDAGPSGGGAANDAGVADGGAAAAGPADAGAADAGPGSMGYLLVLHPLGAGRGARAVPNPLVPYTLLAALEKAPADVEREPNDDPQRATLLGESGTATGWLSPPGDADWYRVHVDAPSVARVEVTGLERADVELAVYGPAAAGQRPPLLARANEGGVHEGEVLPSVGLPPGDSFVLVQPAARKEAGRWVRDGEDATTAYRLTVQLAPDDGTREREPNDDLAHAQEVPLPARVRGTLWPKRDVDVFSFAVPEGHAPVSVRLSAVRGVDLQLRLFELRSDGNEIIGSADRAHGEGEEELLSVPLRPGRYAVEVSSPRREASATETYLLSIQ